MSSYEDHSVFDAVVTLIGRFFKAIFSNKVILFMIIAIIGFLVVKNTFFNNNEATQIGQADIPVYQEIAPDKTKALTVAQTSSRVYYVVDYYNDGQTTTLRKYYFYNKKKWELSKLPLPFKNDEIRIYTR